MKRSRNTGFTLIEMMIALFVAAIIVGLAIPNVREFSRNSRLAGASNELLRSLQLARNEAIKRQLGGVQSVVVCASADPTAAIPTCGFAGQDFQGWFVFQDTNGDWQFGAGDIIIERHGLVDASVTVRSNNDSVVSYVLTGFTNPTPPGALQRSTAVVICDIRGNQLVGTTDSTARALIIDQTGRSRVTRDRTLITNAIALDATLTCP